MERSMTRLWKEAWPCHGKRHDQVMERSMNMSWKELWQLHLRGISRSWLRPYQVHVHQLSINRILRNVPCKKYIKARAHAEFLVRLNTLSVPRLCCPRFSITNSLWCESWSKPKLCLCLPRGLAGSSEVCGVERALAPHALHLSSRTEDELRLVFRVNKMSRFSSNKTTL